MRKIFVFPILVLLLLLNADRLVAGPNKDTLKQIKADPALGFNFDYLLYLPKGISRDTMLHLIAETNNNGLNDSIEYHEHGARQMATERSAIGNSIARRLRIPLLIPIFPRSSTNWTIYTHALDRDAMLSKDKSIQRLDLQLAAMILDAQKRLKNSGYQIHTKIFMTGFSASGTFANRFTMLHPEMIQAVAAGGINAIAILPVAEVNEVRVEYPLGIADIEQITGRGPDLETYKKIPQYLYMGELDDNDAAAFDDAYSDEERTIIYKQFGKKLSDRWWFMEKQYMRAGVKATFRTYPAIGHGTDGKIKNDLVQFFSQHK